MSAAESVVSTAVGFVVSLVLTFIALPAFGYAVTVPDAIGITAVFTAASVIRSYMVRRVFNGAR